MPVKFLWTVMAVLWGVVAQADDTIRKAHPDKVVVMSRFDAGEITTVFTASQMAGDLETIRRLFEAQGLQNPQLRPLNFATLVADLERPGTALIVSAQDGANPILQPVYDVPDMRFAVVNEAAEARAVKITFQGRDIIGSGAPEPAEGPSRPVILTNGALQDNYGTFLHPSDLPAAQVQQYLVKAGITARTVRPFTDQDVFNLRAPDVALLSDASAFQMIALHGLAALFSDPSVYLMENKVVFQDVTKLIRDSDFVADPATQSLANIGLIDRSSAIPVPFKEAAATSAPAPRERLAFDFYDLDPGVCTAALPTPNPERVALVVGNGSYFPDIGWLENPPSDAQQMAALLYSLGFGVYYTAEASRDVIEDCNAQLASAHPLVDVALLYYAGHGLQLEDQNYLVGINARKEADLAPHLVSVDGLTGQLRAISRSTLIMLDACRDNPFEAGSAGLAAISGQAGGTEIPADQNDFAVIYAAAPNAVALDGTDGNSPFTQAMIEALSVQGIPVQEAIVRVSAAVQRNTNYQQQPFVRSNLTRLIYLNSAISLTDLQDRSEQLVARADAAQSIGDRIGAIAEILRAFPSNASDAEIRTHFGGALAKLRSAYFVQLERLENQPKLASYAMGLRNGSRYLLADEAGQVQYLNTETGEVLFSAQMDSVERISVPAPTASRDESVFAFALSKDRVAIHDAETGARIRGLSNFNLPDDVARYSQLGKLQFSPDGSLLLVSFFNWYMLFDVQTGEELFGFGSIILADGEQHGIQALDLLDDTICFAVKQTTYQSDPALTIGKFDVATQTIQAAYSDPRDIGIENVRCSPDGRLAMYRAFSADGNFQGGFLELLDLGTGKVSIRDDNSSYATVPPQMFFSAEGDRVLLTGNFGMSLVDLADYAAIYSEPQQEWHWSAGEYTTVIMPPFGMVGIGASPSVPDRLFEIDLEPNALIEAAMSDLPADLRTTVKSERPVIPD